MDTEHEFGRNQMFCSDPYGKFYRGRSIKTNERVIIQEIDLKVIEEEEEEVQEEVNNLRQYKSPLILEIQDFCRIDSNKMWIVKKTGHFHTVQELLMPDGLLKEECIGIIIREVLKALEELHSKEFIHGSVNADNIILLSNGEVKLNLCMFGESKKQASRKHSYFNIPIFKSPENIMQQNRTAAGSCDVWGIGICALMMGGIEHIVKWMGEQPQPEKLIFQIPSNPPSLDPTKTHSSNFRDFVTKCLQIDPSKRPTAKDLLTHPFISTTTLPQQQEKKIIDDVDMNCTCFKQVYSIGMDGDSSSDEEDFEDMMNISKIPTRYFWSWNEKKVLALPQNQVDFKILKEMNRTGLFEIDRLGTPEKIKMDEDEQKEKDEKERTMFLIGLFEEKDDDKKMQLFEIKFLQRSETKIVSSKILLM